MTAACRFRNACLMQEGPDGQTGLTVILCTLLLGAWSVLALLTACGGGSGGITVNAGNEAGGSAVSLPTAPPATPSTAFVLTEVASGLANPWGLAFLPDGRTLITERGGRLRLMAANGSSTALVCLTWCWTPPLPATSVST
jgi:glucose/arabinose dehydrogenase